MRKLIEASFMSLDGVVEAPERWGVPLWGEENRRYSLEQLDEFDAFVLGRGTYEKFAATWPQIRGVEYYDRINAMPKFVASTTLVTTTWNATLLEGDVADAVAKLKRQPGKNLLKYGTGGLDRTLVRHGLIDEFRVSVFPVVVGAGTRFLDGVDGDLKLDLTATKRMANGIVTLTYIPR